MAYKMLRSTRYDAEREIEGIKARAFGIDLHWMPHVQGAIALSELVKKHHPHTPVIFGGLSSTTFIRSCLSGMGRSITWCAAIRPKSPARRLVEAIKEGRPPYDVPNVTFRDNDGTVKANDLTFVPDDLDYSRIDYGHIIRKVARYRDFLGYVPLC